MLTPFGNPQNLYLYSYFNIPTGEFMGIMLPAFLVAITLLAIASLPVKPIKFTISEEFGERLNIKKTVLYLVLFLASILIVFRVIPYGVGLVVIPIILLFVDKESLLMVDYGLLGTFFFFFIFAGNLSRIPAVNELLSYLLSKDTLIVSALSCQAISNVPTAILLSRFTEDYPALLIGVNIGGTGTIIASLASLITFSEFKLLHPEQTKKYLMLFTVVNFAFLIIMLIFAKVFL
jgi:Na+/H+ antiporter NhaD/arsenite permease-like protein